MCGFFGIWTSNFVDSYKLIDLVKESGLSISHRGPDDNGYWIENSSSISMSHRRLSILDLTEAGKQPMISNSGRYIISFNGEIYNHLDLRNEINLQRKINWKSNSDTETLLNAFDIWGINQTLNMSAGMFAIALWDKLEKKLHLIRDRYGEKPLYYGELDLSKKLFDQFKIPYDTKIFIFSSDLNAFTNIPGFSNAVSMEAKFAFFKFGFIPSPLSIYENINQLEPSTHLQLKSSNEGLYVREKKKFLKWWRLPEESKDKVIKKNLKKKDVINELDNLMNIVFEQTSISDAPLGVFLSGGIDSSLVAAKFQSINSNSINTFSIGYKDEGYFENLYDESKYAEETARFLGTNHQNIYLSHREIIDYIPKLGDIYSEPFADSSQLPTYLVCKEAKRSGLKVSLTGDGGDEIFGGYNRYWVAPLIKGFSNLPPKKLRNKLINMLEKLPFFYNDLKREKYQKLLRLLKNNYTNLEIYEQLLSLNDIFSTNNNFLNNLENDLSKKLSLQESLIYFDKKFYLPFDVLTKVDRASMANSFETRAPFLDYRISDFIGAIPNEMKIKIGISGIKNKWILREILKKYIPNHFINRRKMGFSLPINNWLRGPLRSMVEDLISKDKLIEDEFLSHKKIAMIWEDHINYRSDNTKIIWAILMWRLWEINKK